MKYLFIVLTSLIAVLVLFLLTKLMGNKQISQMTMFDYITGISIGSIAAELATALEEDFLEPLVAMAVFALVAFLLAVLTSKSIKLRRLVTGRAIILYENGKIYPQSFKKAKIDANEFLLQCRIQGYFDIADIQSVFLETNGAFSILPRSMSRPATPRDLNLSPEQEKPLFTVISDGRVLRENLRRSGKDEKWLEKQLSAQGIKSEKTVFIGNVDKDGNLSCYLKNEEKQNHDMFQ